MRLHRYFLFALLLSLLISPPLFAPPLHADEPLDPVELSRKLDELYRSSTSHGVMTMSVTTPHYERTLKMEIWSRGMDDTLAIINAPPKERGTSTLKRGGEMWNYLPKIDKTIRIPPSMMMASWMGSDFTNDDLMRETSWEADYHVALTPSPPEGQVGIEYTPREGAPVTWSRVVGYLYRDSLLPVKMEYYDEKERLVRVMNFEEIVEMGGRTIPRKMILTPLSEEKKGNRTEIIYQEMSFDIELPANLFSLSSLRRRR